MTLRGPLLFVVMGILFALVGFFQSWNFALSIMTYCLISAIMSLGVNMQWGYAGIFNVGIPVARLAESLQAVSKSIMS